jgi:hypothetical protein
MKLKTKLLIALSSAAIIALAIYSFAFGGISKIGGGYYNAQSSGSVSFPITAVQGGTGTTTAPTTGQLLMGNASSTYSLVATSSLGITGISVLYTATFPLNATSTQVMAPAVPGKIFYPIVAYGSVTGTANLNYDFAGKFYSSSTEVISDSPYTDGATKIGAVDFPTVFTSDPKDIIMGEGLQMAITSADTGAGATGTLKVILIGTYQ